MSKKKPKKSLALVELHDEKAKKWAIYGCFALLFILSLLIRKPLIHFQDGDLTLFSQWYVFVKQHGIHSFKYGYSNYNPPYTYFLYLVSLLPLSKIVALKSLLGLFDVFLATSVYFVVKVFRPGNYVPLMAALATMFLPTVLVTGVMWGQFDDFYVSAMLFSLYFALRGNSRWAWIAFGISISIKFQAIFFLPLLIILVFKRIHWYDAFWAVIAFLVLTLPPAIFGRSISSLLNIYPAQTQLANGILNLNAPTLYAWFPGTTFPYLYHMGVFLAIAVCVFILLASLQFKKITSRDILVGATLLLYVVPFFLPEMHERYFFPAGMASMVLAFVYPTKSFIGIAIAEQVITLFSYSPFLFNSVPIPMGILSIFTLVIICILGYNYFAPSLEKETKIKAVA